jgi:elongation factor Ts
VEINAVLVKELREITGAGMMDCKRALEEAGGDLERAREILRTKGLADAKKRAGKVATEGLVEAYIHLGGKLGVLVEVNSETDFVANTEEFRALARDIAMQVAAHDPWWISREEVPSEVLEQERKVYEAQAREQGKPDHVIQKIVDGKLESFLRERCLLEQPFFKDPEGKKTVGDVIAELSSRVGEKVEVRRFARFVRGEDGSRG